MSDQVSIIIPTLLHLPESLKAENPFWFPSPGIAVVHECLSHRGHRPCDLSLELQAQCLAYSVELLQLGPKSLPEYKLDQSIAFSFLEEKKKSSELHWLMRGKHGNSELAWIWGLIPTSHLQMGTLRSMIAQKASCFCLAHTQLCHTLILCRKSKLHQPAKVCGWLQGSWLTSFSLCPALSSFHHEELLPWEGIYNPFLPWQQPGLSILCAVISEYLIKEMLPY